MSLHFSSDMGRILRVETRVCWICDGESALRLADARVRAYAIEGVPALVVNGQFVTGVSLPAATISYFNYSIS